MRWALLAAGSIACAALAQFVHLPAAWLIGPMVVAIAVAVSGFTGRVPRAGFNFAQALLAVTVSQTISPPILVEIAAEWAPILLVVVLSVCAAGISAWLLARYSEIPAETAAWGSTPGGATTMIMLAADFGADPRLVAFMQYLRVTLVILTASTVSRLLLGESTGPPHHITASGPFDGLRFAETLLFALAAGAVGRYSRLPGGQFLVPLIVAGIVHATGLFHPFVPWWLLDGAYLTIGWSVGLLYTPATVRLALRVLPVLALSTCVLIALSGAAGMLLVVFAHVDPMTAYLATTPGGLDSVPVIALDSGANLPLILAAQTIRVFVVIGTGPPLAKLIGRLAASKLAARVG